MPNKTAAAFFLTLFLVTVAVAQGEWPRFKSTEENFTISMPREPQQERTTGRTPLGNGHHIYTLDDNGVSFTVSYSVLDGAPTQSKDIKRTLDMARDLVAMVTNGKLLTDTDISIDNFPGRLVRIEKDKRIWTVHAYLVKDRMYQLMTTEPKAKEPNASVAKFFESFQLLQPPA
ncbi:MAG TPA: hypothetical protein VFV34_06760 [Blastocatellia bacterium]|nr:hypothetical protein [Blastocatellia bacterium]